MSLVFRFVEHYQFSFWELNMRLYAEVTVVFALTVRIRSCSLVKVCRGHNKSLLGVTNVGPAALGHYFRCLSYSELITLGRVLWPQSALLF